MISLWRRGREGRSTRRQSSKQARTRHGTQQRGSSRPVGSEREQEGCVGREGWGLSARLNGWGYRSGVERPISTKGGGSFSSAFSSLP